MMAGVGGYQAPRNPSPVAMPGALSQRTDGGPAQKPRYVSGMPYGEGKELMEMQTSAPMEAAPNVPSAGGARAGVNQAVEQQPVVPLNAPSMLSDIPVTDGAALGPGAGPESLGLDAQNEVQNKAFANQIAMYMPVLMQVASNPNISPETRDVIRRLRNML